MKINFLYLIPLLFLSACVSNNNENNSSSDSSISIENPEHILTNSEKLEDYLMALDSSDINNSAKAAAKFDELFDKKDSLENDKGVALILDFMDRISLFANQNTFEEAVNYSPLVNIELKGAEKAVPENLATVFKKINDNGFRVRETEGMYDLKINPFYVQEKFYPYISSNFEIYLQQLARENMEGYAEDAAIAIPFQTLVQRVIWWEDFARNTQNTHVGLRATNQYQKYLYTLTVGMDNTPTIENQQISAYFHDAYSYLKDFAPKSDTYLKLKDYIDLLEQQKIEEAKALIPNILGKDFKPSIKTY